MITYFLQPSCYHHSCFGICRSFFTKLRRKRFLVKLLLCFNDHRRRQVKNFTSITSNKGCPRVHVDFKTDRNKVRPQISIDL